MDPYSHSGKRFFLQIAFFLEHLDGIDYIFIIRDVDTVGIPIAFASAGF